MKYFCSECDAEVFVLQGGGMLHPENECAAIGDFGFLTVAVTESEVRDTLGLPYKMVTV